MAPGHRSTDVVEVSDVIRTLRRQWRAVLGFLAIGVLGAMTVQLFAPRRFEGKATVLARPAAASGGSILGRLGGGMGELIGNVAGIGGGKSDFETELQVLKSRDLAGRLVDSLRLQVQIREPDRVPPSAVVAAADFPGRFAPRTYRLERGAGGYATTDAVGRQVSLAPGAPASLDGGTITLAQAALPPRLELRVFDREDAITRLAKRLNVTKAGGDVTQIVYRGPDSVTAAAVPNALVAFYLERRQTTDRGVNARRVEFITAQLDSVGALLTSTEAALRRYQEQSGVLDAALVGEAKWVGAVELTKSLAELEVEAAGVNELLAASANGSLPRRQLAAHPSFMKGPAMTPLVSHLNELEAQKIRLLERRTERDPEVVALQTTINGLEAQILATARAYAQSVNTQRATLATQLDSMERSLGALPAAAERGGRLQRDVMRQTAIYSALQAQLVEARLGAIGEGGEIKQLDLAAVPRRPVFPRPLLTLGLGSVGGLLAGVIAALFLSWFGRSLRDPVEVERIAGVSAQRFIPDAPLLLLGRNAARTVLVVPLDPATSTEQVADRLLRTAQARTGSATTLDLSNAAIPAGNGAGPSHGVAESIQAAEQSHGLVVVRLPALTHQATLAALDPARPVLLVAPGIVDRERLSSALEFLRRLDVPCAGVMIGDGQVPARARLLS